MKTIVTVAAFAAFLALAATGNASAETYQLPAAEIETCRVLEMAGEISCAEYEIVLRERHAAAGSAGADEMTGSIAPATASYIPYVNGAGDPDGLTRSNRQFPAAGQAR